YGLVRLSFLPQWSPDPPDLPSFPTRRSSDLGGIQGDVLATDNNTVGMGDAGIKSAIQGSNVPNPNEAVPSFVSGAMAKARDGLIRVDRKSGSAGMPRPISYAVFCLKKKKHRIHLTVCRGRRLLRKVDVSSVWRY